MNKILKKITLIFIFIFCFSLIACGAKKNVSENKINDKNSIENVKYPISINNYNSDKLEITETFKDTPKRVISTNQTTTEILLELGLGDKMVGTSFLDNTILPSLKEQYDKIPVLADKYPSKEIVLEKNPDFIIGWLSAFTEKNIGTVSSWNEKGVNTFIQRNSGVIKKCNLENIYKDIEDIGKIFDIEEKANTYVTEMKNRINTITEKVNKLNKKKKVLVIEGSGENKYRAYGNNSLAADMVEKAGGINLSLKSGEIGLENIIEMNPDIVVLIYFEQQVKDNKDAEVLLNNPALQKVNAIKDKKILYTPLAETYAGGVRTVSGIENMSKGFYPDVSK